MQISQTSKPPSIYELMRGFWRENEEKPFSTAAIALYHFLLERANSRCWKMPFTCPTEVAAHAIGVTKQTIVSARTSLKNRGFIRFTSGTSRTQLSNYWLNLDLSGNLSGNLSVGLSDSLSDKLSDSLSQDLTPNNKKEKEIKNKTFFNNNNQKDESILNLDELQASMAGDEAWLMQMGRILEPEVTLDLDGVKGYLKRFFAFLRTRGYVERREEKCRTHFENWLKKQPIENQQSKPLINKPNPYATSFNPIQSLRRGTEVTATSPSDYEGAF